MPTGIYKHKKGYKRPYMVEKGYGFKKGDLNPSKTKEARERVSIWSKNLSPEIREKGYAKTRGRHSSPSTEFKKGRKHTEEEKVKMRGRIPWNKNISPTDKTRENMSNGQLNSPKSRKGKTYKEIYGDNYKIEIEKRRLSHLKLWDKKGRKLEKRPKHQGSKYNVWRSSVYERDNFTDAKTGQKGGKLEVHHILNFHNHLELRFDVNNGVTLSKESHRLFHHMYGNRNNTKEQIDEFLNKDNI